MITTSLATTKTSSTTVSKTTIIITAAITIKKTTTITGFCSGYSLKQQFLVNVPVAPGNVRQAVINAWL